MKRRCFFHNSYHTKLLTEVIHIAGMDKHKIEWSICNQCCLIFQSNSLSKSSLNLYYKKNITHFNDKDKPSEDKIYNTNRQLNIIKDNLKKFPNSVLEVSLLNDYNLKKYKFCGAQKVEGLEPNKIISEAINKKKVFKVHNSTIENFRFKKKYELIVLSHVLEHLMNPLKVLKKCNRSQINGQHVLLEVPLFEALNRYKNGALMMEHLSYFNEYNFLKLILESGYEPVYISKIYERTLMPFITVLAKKNNKFSSNFLELNKISFKNQYKKEVKNYLKKNKSIWKKIDQKLSEFDKTRQTYIYGSGLHASLLFKYTNIEQKFNIVGFLDSSKSKNNTKFKNYLISNPNINNINKKSNIIIASISSEKTIYDSLKLFRKKGINTYCLYS